MNILVTGAGGGIAQGVIKSLKMIKDLRIKIIAADSNKLASGLYSAHKSYILPKYNSTSFKEALAKLFLDEKIDYYIPGTDYELEFSAQNKKLFRKKYGITTIVSPLPTIKLANNKYSTFQFLKDNNFSHPDTYLKDNVNINELCFPIIIKPIIGSRSIGVKKIENIEDLKSSLLTNNSVVIQEHVGDVNKEYTCTIVKNRDLLSDVIIFQRELRSGDTYKARPVKSKIIAEYILKVAKKLDFHGPCNFQLRLDKNDIPKIFEINCRFSGTTPFCSQVGFNPLEFYLKIDLKKDYKYKVDYNVKVLRYWSEILIDEKTIEELNDKKKIMPKFLSKINLFDLD